MGDSEPLRDKEVRTQWFIMYFRDGGMFGEIFVTNPKGSDR